MLSTYLGLQRDTHSLDQLELLLVNKEIYNAEQGTFCVALRSHNAFEDIKQQIFKLRHRGVPRAFTFSLLTSVNGVISSSISF
jgi:hypothetical protein